MLSAFVGLTKDHEIIITQFARVENDDLLLLFFLKVVASHLHLLLLLEL